MPSEAEVTRRWLNDISHNNALAQTFTARMSYEALRDDLRTTYAVVRCLEIVSETSRRLPDELKARHPSIAWARMAGGACPKFCVRDITDAKEACYAEQSQTD